MPPLSELQIAKIQASTSVALPIADDPFAIVAEPIGADRQAVVDWIKSAFESGLLLGVHGEPNPELRESREMILSFTGNPPEDISPETIVRWSGTDPEGVTWQSAMTMSESPHPTGNPAREFFKCGLPVPPIDPMNPGADRSFLVQETRPGIPKLTDPQVMLAGSLFQPAPFDPEQPLWPQISSSLNLPAKDAQAAARQLVVGRVWRRFALRFRHDGLGGDGAGLACWKFGDTTELPHAARALAALSGCGDVSIRTATPGFPYNLAALMTSRDPGAAEAIARKASNQWNRPLGRWIPLRLV